MTTTKLGETQDEVQWKCAYVGVITAVSGSRTRNVFRCELIMFLKLNVWLHNNYESCVYGIKFSCSNKHRTTWI